MTAKKGQIREGRGVACPQSGHAIHKSAVLTSYICRIVKRKSFVARSMSPMSALSPVWTIRERIIFKTSKWGQKRAERTSEEYDEKQT